MAGYRELDVWKLGRELAVRVYRHCASFPAEEKFGLTAQLQRAAVSIACNIAEGYARRNPADYCRFLRIAKGSLNEVETLLVIASDLGLGVPEEELAKIVPTLGRKLSNLIDTIGVGIVREDLASYELAEMQEDATARLAD